MPSVWGELLTVTQTIIQELGLTYDGSTALPNGQVYVRKFPSDRNASLPFVMVALGGREEMAKGDFEDTEIVYPVLVVHAFVSNQELALNDDELYWRQQITDVFLDLPRPEVLTAQVPECLIDPNPVLDLRLFSQANVDVGGLTLRFRTIRARAQHG